MQLKNLFLSIPRSTWETLVKHHIVRKNVLMWYDLIQFFDSIDFSDEANRRCRTRYCKPFGQMDKYIYTAEEFHLSDEQTRKIISRLNRYV